LADKERPTKSPRKPKVRTSKPQGICEDIHIATSPDIIARAILENLYYV
jgi:hypothetical protein